MKTARHDEIKLSGKPSSSGCAVSSSTKTKPTAPLRDCRAIGGLLLKESCEFSSSLREWLGSKGLAPLIKEKTSQSINSSFHSLINSMKGRIVD